MRSAKLIIAVVAVLLLAAFQVAVQAKPARAYEVHLSIKGAGTVDEDPGLTQANLLDPACSTAPTTPSDTVGQNCYPGDPSGDYGWGWVVRWKATPAPGYTFVRWQSDGSATTSVKCDGAFGSDIYTGSACQFATFENLQTRAVFADTTAPSTPSITSTTPTSTNQAVSFNFQQGSSDPTWDHFECRVTPLQGSFSPCSSGISYNPSDGNYVFEVRSVDHSGNTSASATRSWTEDKTGPGSLQITSAPSALTNQTAATFSFVSYEPNTLFRCSLDGATYSPCTSPKTYTGLSEGNHSFGIQAVDTLGNIGVSLVRSWKIDLTPPNTTLDSGTGPAQGSTTPITDATFGFSSSEPTGATFECNLQGPGFTSTDFTACTSPKAYTHLTDGTYTFSVRAKDQVGNVDGSPAQRTWTVRNPPKVLTSSLIPLKGATGVSRTTNVSATFSEAMYPDSLRNPFTGVSKTFKLQQYVPTTKKWKAIPAIVAYDEATNTAALDPYGATETGEKALPSRTKFKATITTGATDAAGTPLAKNFSWTFTTGRK